MRSNLSTWNGAERGEMLPGIRARQAPRHAADEPELVKHFFGGRR
jgi:hypothetical protein